MSESNNLIPFKRQLNRSVIAILASTLNNIVGSNNTLPWQCRRDMYFFKLSTVGNVVIMGRKTYESMGSKPLPRRVNIVITRTPESILPAPNLTVVTTIEAAIKVARMADLSRFDRHTKFEHIFIIGGVDIYKQTAFLIDEIIHSTINVTVDEGIGQDLFTSYLPLDSLTNEILYYNSLLNDVDSKHTLKEVVHYHNANLNNTFSLKR